jgi:hypothetical protein
MDRFGVCLPFLIQFPFGSELFHFYTLLLLGMVPYEVLTISGGFQASLIILGLQPYTHKVCDSYFLFYKGYVLICFLIIIYIPFKLFFTKFCKFRCCC